jgi:hypothetical protein
MENWERADVSTPRIRTAVRMRRFVLLFEGRVNFPVTMVINDNVIIQAHTPHTQRLLLPDNSDVTEDIRKGQRSNSVEWARIITICIQFLTCYFPICILSFTFLHSFFLIWKPWNKFRFKPQMSTSFNKDHVIGFGLEIYYFDWIGRTGNRLSKLRMRRKNLLCIIHSPAFFFSMS